MGWVLGALVLLAGLSWLGKRWLGRETLPATGTDPTPGPPAEFDGECNVHVGDELDLHGVDPREVGELVDAFVDDAHARRRRQIRIIHGKGIGAMRAQVRARLERHTAVRAYRDAPPPSSWGATVVELRDRTRDVEADHATD